MSSGPSAKRLRQTCLCFKRGHIAMAENAESLEVCPECTKSYDEPILLPCLHNFCRKCIAGKSEITGSRNRAACPRCNEQFEIPAAGVDALPKNSFLVNYLKLKDLLGSSDQPCDLCSSNDIVQEELKFASVYCLVCRQKFCSSCASFHNKINVCRKHEQLNLCDEAVDTEVAMTNSPTTCVQHQEKRLKYYCKTCKQAVCQLCYIGKHQSHKCSDLAEPAKTFREEVTKNATSLMGLVEECRQMLTDVSAANDTFDDQKTSIEDEVRARADEIRDEINQQVQEITNQLSVIQKKRCEEVEKIQEEIKQRMASLERVMSYAKELASKGSPGDILQQTDVIHDRIHQLKDFNKIRRSFKALGSTTVKFQPSGPSNGIGAKLIGKVISGNLNGNVEGEKLDGQMASDGVNRQMSSDSATRQVANDSVSRQVARDNSDANEDTGSREKEPVPETRSGSRVISNGNGTVSGVAVLGNQLFIVRYNGSKQVQVYDRETLAPVRNFLVQEAKSLFGLASCSYNNCLYISDSSGHKMHKVDLSSSNGQTRWDVAKSPLGLSVNRSKNILVACSAANKIQEYDANGKLLREILLRAGDNKPVYVKQLASGQLAVSYGELLWSRFYVSLVKADGTIDRTFCEDHDSSLKSLKGSTEIELDSAENMLIVDWTKHRIMVLSRDLRSSRDLQLEIDGGLKQPYALHFDELRGQLIVGEYPGRVVVFDGVHIA